MRSLWTDPDRRSFPTLDGDIEVDVAIIGAGLAGLGAAYALSELGARVAVLEARSIAAGASGRNAGFVLAGPAMSYDRAVQAIGLPSAESAWSFTIANNRLIADLIDEYEIECGYVRRGSMSLAADEEEWRSLLDSYACLSTSGIPTCLVARPDLPRPFDRLYTGGLYYPGNAEMNPAAFLRGIAERLRSAISFYEGTAVVDTHWNNRWILRTERGNVAAERAILATNAYTTSLLPGMPIAPRRGQVLATVPVGRVVVPFPMYGNNGYRYWRQTPEGRLVAGGWRDIDLAGEVGTEHLLHDRIQGTLDAFCRDLLGEESTVEHRWSGIMGFTPDMFPLVGPVPDQHGLFVAAGFSGHGVAMAFRCGMSAAQLAIGELADIPDAFRASRLLESVAP